MNIVQSCDRDRSFYGLTVFSICVLALFIFVLSIFPVQSDDIGTHLKTGEFIFREGKILTSDPFSFTRPASVWINVEWLGQVVFYLIYQWAGITGLILFKFLVVLGIFLIIARFLILLRFYNFFSYLLLFFGAFICAERFIERPHIFADFFMTFFLCTLFIAEVRPTRFLYGLPLVQILWANMNYSAILGAGIFLFFFVSRLFARKEIPRSYYLCFFATCLAACMNPSGVFVYLEPLRFFFDNFYNQRQFIYEWMSPFQRMYLSMPYVILYFFLLFCVVVWFFANFRRIRLHSWFLLVLFSVLSLRAVRFIPSACYGILVVFYAAYAQYSSPESRGRFSFRFLQDKKIFLIITFLGLFGSIWVAFFGYQTGFLQRKFGFGIHPSRDIKGVVSFLRQADIQGNMFNQLDLGSYLIWNAYPERKVFIDGRVIDCYPPKFFVEDYVTAGRSKEDLERIIAKHAIDYFILTYPRNGLYSIWKFLDEDPRFMVLYWDDYHVIFARVDRFPSRVQYAYRILKPFLNDAAILSQLEAYPQAVSELNRLLQFSAHSRRANMLGGLYFFNQRDYRRAKELLEKSFYQGEALSPLVYLALGLIAESQGDCKLFLEYTHRFFRLSRDSSAQALLRKKMQACFQKR